jgi:hypothetical protein
LETLRATVCLPYASAWDAQYAQAEEAVSKTVKLARTKAEKAVAAPLPATEKEMATAPAGWLATYEFRLLGSRTTAMSVYDASGGWSNCKDDVSQYADRSGIMKALGITEGEAVTLAGQVPMPNSQEIADAQKQLDDATAVLDRAIGMFTRAAAVARDLETWYKIDPDHPKAKTEQQEWCGNQGALVQEMHEVHVTASDPRLGDAMNTPDVDQESVRGIVSKEHTIADLLKTLISEQNQLKGMGCTCQ